jgi:cell division septation protein DedD
MSVVEEFDPKKRLVGAAILIGLAVIMLPVILDSDDGSDSTSISDQDQFIQGLRNDYVSSEEEVTVFVSKITPIEENSTSIDKGTEPKTVVADSSAPKRTPANKPVVKKLGSPAVSSNTVERGWMVRVGTFVNAVNVKKLLVDLSSKGFEPDTDTIETSRGMATRIWIGPYQRRVDAARARTRLEQQTGEPGLITIFP